MKRSLEDLDAMIYFLTLWNLVLTGSLLCTIAYIFGWVK